jgi:hypothetical protein
MQSSGWIKIHRKILDNEIWRTKPSQWMKVWLYILAKVSHGTKEFPVGTGFFNFSKERELIGNDVTVDQVKKALQCFVRLHMISTKRSTRGTIVKVARYADYQMLDCETSTDVGTSKAREKHHDKQELKNSSNTNVLEPTVPGGTHVATPKGRNPEVQELVDYWNQQTGAIKVSPLDRRAVYNLLRNKTLLAQNPGKTPVEIAKAVIDVAVEAKNWSGRPFPPRVATLQELYNKIDSLKDWYMAKEKGGK